MTELTHCESLAPLSHNTRTDVMLLSKAPASRPLFIRACAAAAAVCSTNTCECSPRESAPDLKCNLCGGGCHTADQRRFSLRVIRTGVRYPDGSLCEQCVEWLEAHGRMSAETIDGVQLAKIPVTTATTAITITEDGTVMRGGEWVIPEDYQTADLALDESRVATRAPCDGFYLLANEIAKGSEV